MSSIKVVKGNPIAFLLTVKHNSGLIDLNDGTWTTQVKICFQTPKGAQPGFTVTTAAQSSGVIVSMTGDQTNTLRSDGTGYVLVVQCVKNDASVTINNVVPMQVTNDLF